MIERESKLDAERPLVSSVIYNRLRTRHAPRDRRDHRVRAPAQPAAADQPRPLHEDAVQHVPAQGLAAGTDRESRASSRSQAAAAPADTPFLYYVLTGKDGSHTFTTNLADFLVAEAKSKEVFGR